MIADSDRITGRLLDLVATRSETGEEHAAIELVAHWLAEDGADEIDHWIHPMADLERDPAYPGREVDRPEVPVVAARIRGTRPGPTVVLTGHVDTVAVGDQSRWTRDPGGQVDGDLVFGRGSCDMKGGMVAALEAFRHLAAIRDFAGELRLVAVPGEEDGGTGTLAAIRRGWTGDMAILTEPTSGPAGPQIVVAHGGALTFSIDVRGRAAHGSRPDTGVSALDMFLLIVPVVEALERQVNDMAHPLLTTLGRPHATTIGIVRGGTWASNVMESLHAEARVGVAIGETIEQAQRRFVEGLTSGARSAHPWLAEHPPTVVRTGAAFGSSSIPQDHPLVSAVADAAEAVTGRRAGCAAAPYGCDMALWIGVGGAATVVYGPGDVAVAHAADERVSVQEIVGVAGTLAAACRNVMVDS